MTTIRLDRIGWKAAAALAASGHEARVVATLSDSIYLAAGDELVWLGGAGATLHGRAMLLTMPGVAHVTPLPPSAETLEFDVGLARPWEPLPAPPTSASLLATGARTLAEAISEIGEPQGFGALLTCGTLAFPLDRARDPALALARACTDGDPAAASAAVRDLIGLGPGLTPAGDDYVGGTFFARALLGDGSPAWRQVADTVVARARSHTHPVSAALLADLCAGAGWAPLHELAGALAGGASLSTTLEAARRLARIGHSSGWDILAGFLGALAGLPRGR